MMALDQFRENLFDIVGGEAANERLLGLNSGSVESMQKTGLALARSFEDAKLDEDERSRKSIAEVAFLTLLDQLNGQLDWLQEQAANKAREIEARYGEDWREQAAHIVFDDPDDIPQRAEGESMEAYRDRLEQELIDELYDENGELKDKFKDHPDPLIQELIELAAYRRALAEVEADVIAANEISSDPSLTSAEKDDQLQELMERSDERALEIARRSGELSDDAQAVADAQHNRNIDAASVGASEAALDNSGF